MSDPILPSGVETARLVAELARGDVETVERLTPILHSELHELAERLLGRERPGHTLQATALVNEAFLRMVGQDAARIRGRAHFLALAATIMRRILVDHARARRRLKRGGASKPVTLHEGIAVLGESSLDVLAIDEALGELAALDARQARVVELRFFAGASHAEIAAALGVAERTIDDDWRMARAWLRARLDPDRGT